MSLAPTACLIIIGNEILSGRTQDTNLNWLAQHLNTAGVTLAHARVIPDIEEIIIATINECRKAYDYVFTTGGIGPTHDDITSAAIAKAFKVKLARHPEAERRLRAHYDPANINEARLKMADIPEGATLIDNPVSTAPGFQIENVFVLAGVPIIMQAMFEHLKERLRGGTPTLSRSLAVLLPEGDVAAGIAEIQRQFPDVEIGSYPHIERGKLSTALVFRSPNAERLNSAVTQAERFIASLKGEIKAID